MFLLHCIVAGMSVYLPMASERHTIFEMTVLTFCLVAIVPTRTHNVTLGRMLLTAALYRCLPVGLWKLMVTIVLWLVRVVDWILRKTVEQSVPAIKNPT